MQIKIPTKKEIQELFSKHWLAMVFSVFVLGVSGYYYLIDYLPVHKLEVEKNSELSSVLAAAPQVFQVDERTKESDCQIQGSLPDHECSPGAIFENATKSIVCVLGYTKTVRSVS